MELFPNPQKALLSSINRKRCFEKECFMIVEASTNEKHYNKACIKKNYTKSKHLR